MTKDIDETRAMQQRLQTLMEESETVIDKIEGMLVGMDTFVAMTALTGYLGRVIYHEKIPLAVAVAQVMSVYEACKELDKNGTDT
jgi:hypothetical protein